MLLSYNRVKLSLTPKLDNTPNWYKTFIFSNIIKSPLNPLQLALPTQHLPWTIITTHNTHHLITLAVTPPPKKIIAPRLIKAREKKEAKTRALIERVSRIITRKASREQRQRNLDSPPRSSQLRINSLARLRGSFLLFFVARGEGEAWRCRIGVLGDEKPFVVYLYGSRFCEKGADK